MPSDRRNNIGDKVLGSVLSLAVICIMGGTYYQAQANTREIVINKVSVAEIKKTQDFTIKTLERIECKMDKIGG